MSHNIFQPYLLCINVQIIGLYRMWIIIRCWLICAVCLSVSLQHSFFFWNLSVGQNSSKYEGINEAINDMLTCHKFHLLCLANTFKCKTNPKQKKGCCDFILRSATRKRKEKIQLFCPLLKRTRRDVQLVAVGTSS
jgi:hypothetical protein